MAVHLDRGVGLIFGRVKEFHARVRRHRHQACRLRLALLLTIRLHLA